METLAEWQRRFITAMRRPETETETDTDLGRVDGLNVYRNNIRQSLIEALATAFPHTRTLLGARYFAAAAGDYAGEHPPTDPRLMHYGQGFADFLERLPPVTDYPYVGDICRLERARLDVSHAREESPVTAEELAGHPDPEGLVLAPRAATRLVGCRHDIEPLWHALERGETATRIGEGGPGDWLVVRQGHQIRPIHATPAMRGLYRALTGKTNLGEALTVIAEAHGEAGAADALGSLLGQGALSRVTSRRPLTTTEEKAP
ncbi:putative DNA-binding protein [Onishia taeanensis]|uniref:Putative DNA-binding protein n=1 Tax=Onishia taeanensis TaxID=284577 RepID=A0A328XTT7_9GAMM|nr:DNA-binding domain-containing protein [Halomonas taeanensis]RAR63110.1 putative DNA-binding protein [Halomonas taeanensis]